MNNCDCEFCEKCSSCNHRADEHMAGDLTCGICYQCQKEGKECEVPKSLEQFADLNDGPWSFPPDYLN